MLLMLLFTYTKEIKTSERVYQTRPADAGGPAKAKDKDNISDTKT